VAKSKLEERVDRHDKQIAAIRGLVEQGMRMMVETRKVLREVAINQKRTDAEVDRLAKSIKALIDSLRRGGGNGHAQRKDRRFVGGLRSAAG
jgi:hypothetical protein